MAARMSPLLLLLLLLLLLRMRLTRQVGDLWNSLALTPTPTLLRIEIILAIAIVDEGVPVTFRLVCLVGGPAAHAVELCVVAFDSIGGVVVLCHC